MEKHDEEENKQIEIYYDEKKKEVSQWLIDYAGSLKRIKQDQRERLLEYAKEISFQKVGEVNVYVQNLKNVSKKDKKRLFTYLATIEWLPSDMNFGFLDGQLVARITPSNELDAALRAAFGKENQTEDTEE